MPQQRQGDKRGYVLVCEGPSCGKIHAGSLPGQAATLVSDCAWRTGPCLGMCPVGPNAIVRKEPIGERTANQSIQPSDSILCGIADAEDLIRLVEQSLSADSPPRLLKGQATPDQFSR